MNRGLGVLQVLLAGIGFGFLGVFGRWSFQEGLTVGELLFWRFLFAASLLWIWALLFRRELIRLPGSQIRTSLALGFLGYAVFSTLYFESIKGVSVALAAMLLFTFPLFVSLGAHFVLKERMQLRQWFSLALALAGLMILLWGDVNIQSYNAVWMGLGAAVTYSIYVLVSGRVQRNVHPISSSLYVMVGAALGLFAFHQPALSRLPELTSTQLSLLLGIAIFSSILPMSLFLAGLQKMKSSEASILVTIEPVVAAIAAHVILHEYLSAQQVVGAVLVVSALVLNSLSTRR